MMLLSCGKSYLFVYLVSVVISISPSSVFHLENLQGGGKTGIEGKHTLIINGGIFPFMSSNLSFLSLILCSVSVLLFTPFPPHLKSSSFLAFLMTVCHYYHLFEGESYM